MKGVSHGLLGLVGLGLAYAPNLFYRTGLATPAPVEFALLAATAVVGALLPDIDSAESTIRQATATSHSKAGCFGMAVSFVLKLLGGHRMGTHTLLAWGLLTGGGWWLSQTYFHGNAFVLAGSVGYLSHLVADALTVDGVPLLWPVVKRRICLLPSFVAIRTGGVAEYVVVIAVCALALRLWL